MSLVRIALRHAAVEALKGRTLVGDRVLDSDFGALQVDADGSVKTSQDGPFISVFTDSSLAKRDLKPRALMQSGVLDLVFEFGVTKAMARTLDDGTSTIEEIGMPATDRGLELTMDLVARQILWTLTTDEGPWAELFRDLIFGIEESGRERIGVLVDGTRLAGQRLRLAAAPLDDPESEAAIAPDTPMGRYLALAAASQDAGLAKSAALMRTMVAAPGEAWRETQKRLGLTRGELLALGLGPLAQDEERSTPALTAGTIEVEGVGTVTEGEPAQGGEDEGDAEDGAP